MPLYRTYSYPTYPSIWSGILQALIKTLKAENAQQQKNLKQNIESRLEWQKSTKAYLDANSFICDKDIMKNENFLNEMKR